MPRYPDSLINLIRERVDLLELIGRQVTLKKQGSSWMGLCPFHNEKTPSFSLHPDKGYKCFGCGEGGDAFAFLMKSKGIGFTEAVEELAAMTGTPLPRSHEAEDPEAIRRRESRRRVLEILSATRDFYQEQLAAPIGSSARHYLEARGLKPETIRRAGLGFAPLGWTRVLDRFGGGDAAGELLEMAGLVVRKDAGEKLYDRFRDRIIFPILDLKGHCVAFGGRLMGPGEPKYLNSPETDVFQKGKLLYGLNDAQIAIQKASGAIVVEGYMDRLALVDHGLENVVATLGTALTTDHLRLLWQRTRKIYFCFDGDSAGEKAAWRALEMVFDGLEADHHASFLFLPKGEDPDQVVRREGAAGFLERIKTGLSPIEFLIRHLGVGLSAHSPEGRAALVHRARPLLSKVKDPLLRELYAETLSQRLQIPTQFAQATTRRPLAETGRIPPRMPPRPVHTPNRRAMAERDHEQALLALVLRYPRFVMEREEELSRLQLENAQLFALLTELIELGHQFKETPEIWPMSRLSSKEMGQWVRTILAAEELAPEMAEREFEGCLTSIHIKALRQERVRLMRQIDLEGDFDNTLIKRCCALKLEEQRVLGDKVV
ncbi:MAG: DNA primase [Magnetococcales bacterium]|nr:DNA primase [Magnetococcales bacterium]